MGNSNHMLFIPEKLKNFTNKLPNFTRKEPLD